jgi:hypothetical protein
MAGGGVTTERPSGVPTFLLQAGEMAYIPPATEHELRNAGSRPATYLLVFSRAPEPQPEGKTQAYRGLAHASEPFCAAPRHERATQSGRARTRGGGHRDSRTPFPGRGSCSSQPSSDPLAGCTNGIPSAAPKAYRYGCGIPPVEQGCSFRPHPYVPRRAGPSRPR